MVGVWLFIAILSLMGSIHAFTHAMTREGLIFLIMMVLSLSLAYLRHYYRIKNKDKD